MNIWALEKDLIIKQLLLLLQDDFTANSFIIDSETSLGDHEIYLLHSQNPGVRAYVFTFGQQPEKYGVHLEFPQLNTSANLLEAYENLSYKMLADILSVHLDMTYAAAK